ncbi:MAG: hypothetical protein MUO62_07070 [Anaerolineales bacterium]|nr:hypothetical protein [Anaerolineales bacterium]
MRAFLGLIRGQMPGFTDFSGPVDGKFDPNGAEDLHDEGRGGDHADHQIIGSPPALWWRLSAVENKGDQG